MSGKIKTSAELREIVLEQIKDLKEGTSTPKMANAVANLAGKALHTARAELEYARLLGTKPDIPFLKCPDLSN